MEYYTPVNKGTLCLLTWSAVHGVRGERCVFDSCDHILQKRSRHPNRRCSIRLYFRQTIHINQ